jgi:uroporphyrinogen-III synthase
MTKPVLLIRANRNEDDAKALAELGLETVIDPYLTIEPTQNTGAVNQVIAALAVADENTWFVLTSANGINFLADVIGREALRAALDNSNVKFAAIGESTKLVLESYGVREILMPKVADSKHLAEALIAIGPGTAIWPRSAIAMKSFPNQLVEAGWRLFDPAVYETKTIETEPESAKRAMRGDFSSIVVLSPSAGRALAKYVSPKELTRVGTELVCMGQTTATALKELGFEVSRVATTIRGAFE